MFVKYYLKTILVKILFILISVLALNGCGGAGTTGSATGNILERNPFNLSNNDNGIVRERSSTTNSVIFTSTLNATLALIQTNNPNFEYVSTVSETYQADNSITGEYIFKSGTTGDLFNIMAVSYLEGNQVVLAGIGTYQNQSLIFTSGESVKYMPIGTYTYQGTAINNFVPSSGERIDEEGNFSMNINFATGATNLLAETGTLSYSDNSIILDRHTGDLKGTNGSFDYGPGTISGTNFYGQVNGDSAQFVSGMTMGESPKNNRWSSIIVGER